MRLAWPGVVLIGLIGGAIVAVFVLWFGGCAVASVDESDYVAHNEAVYQTLPEYPGATLVNSYSIGIPGGPGFNENGPPYKAFDTQLDVARAGAIPGPSLVRGHLRQRDRDGVYRYLRAERRWRDGLRGLGRLSLRGAPQ